ncbi:MAG: N-6 DNA methylase [Selenomonadaceae bacterium]|nr:N-6 DNA methylase [Selenomonadaceae bacterium]
MLTEKNFAAALQNMNFIARGNSYEKIFHNNIVLRADLATQKLFYPAQIKNHDRNNFYDDSHRENLVVFECVNRLLDKGYNPADIWLEKNWQLGHTQKSGRADICVSSNGKTLFIIECKTAGAEFNQEIKNMLADGGQLFSYWQQEQYCKWIMLYASDFDGKLKFSAKSVSCNEIIYRDAKTVEDKFKIWCERCEKKFSGDVIFHDETVAYKIGVKPLRKRDLKNFSENQSVVNKFEEVLRHNNVSDKENAFNRLIALFIAKLVDESHKSDGDEVDFQFKEGSDTHETFQDRLQKLYADGMKKFMGEDIFYLPEDYPDKVFRNFNDEENFDSQISDLRENFRKLKFYTNNAFAFVEVQNEKLFYLNAKILREVVDILRDYRIIGSIDLQTLGDLFEQLLNKGFKKNEGQFFTPTPIAQFIWDSLPLDDIISDEPPKIIDYACGAGHFLTEGFKAVNDCFARKNLPPPILWERNKLIGIEKDYRLARVSKISLFMHGANEGRIKFGDGLENYPDENISPATFDILVANPPYAIKGFRAHLKLENELQVLDKISNDGSEIETLFAERISQLVKPRGVAAVILPSSILNKDGKSFIAARESLIKNFYIRAVVQLGSKTFGATGTNTVILFLERFDEPPRMISAYEDVAESILSGKTLNRSFSREIFDGYIKKTGKSVESLTKYDRERIIYFGLTFKQMTLIISAPDKNDEQEKFLGYGWSNAKGREGIVHKKRGGFLFDNDNRAAENTLAAVIRAVFNGKQLNLSGLEKYYRYSTLADMIDFDSADFTKKITLASSDYEQIEYSVNFPLVKLGDICEMNVSKSEVANVDDDMPVSFVEMASISNDGYISEKITRSIGEVRKSGYKYFAEGDIIIAKITPCMENGKCAIARGLMNSIGFGSTEFHVFRCRNEKILTEYLFVFLNREDIRQAAQKSMTGSSGHRRVPESFYSKIRIPLPPVDIQRKIVAEFDAIAAQIDSLDKNIEQLDVDIKNKFAELFDGKNFPVQKLGDVCKVARGGSPRPINDYITDDNDGINWIKIGDADENSRYITKTAQRIKPEGKNKSRYVQAGDFLLSNSMTFGKPYILKIDGCIHDGWLVLDYDKTILEENYFHAYLSSPFAYKFMADLASGSVVSNLNSEIIKKLPIKVPPLELQEKFAVYVSNCELMKESARARRLELLIERSELVKKYFR